MVQEKETLTSLRTWSDHVGRLVKYVVLKNKVIIIIIKISYEEDKVRKTQ